MPAAPGCVNQRASRLTYGKGRLAWCRKCLTSDDEERGKEEGLLELHFEDVESKSLVQGGSDICSRMLLEEMSWRLIQIERKLVGSYLFLF
jgi:hypothetical protein